jgi:hypothetical protein
MSRTRHHHKRAMPELTPGVRYIESNLDNGSVALKYDADAYAAFCDALDAHDMPLAFHLADIAVSEAQAQGYVEYDYPNARARRDARRRLEREDRGGEYRSFDTIERWERGVRAK